MKVFRNSASFLAVLLVLLACFTEETEARRRVLRGRRTITRKYYRPSAIPAWAIIVLVALGELLVGVVAFFGMRKMILSSSIETSNTYVPAPTHEAAA